MRARRSPITLRSRANSTSVEALADDKLNEMQRAIALYDKNNVAESQALMRGGEGRDLMDDIRNRVLGMIAEERRLLDLRRADSARTNTYLLAANLAGTGVILLIGAISVYLVQRSNRQREQARRALLERQ